MEWWNLISLYQQKEKCNELADIDEITFQIENTAGTETGGLSNVLTKLDTVEAYAFYILIYLFFGHCVLLYHKLLLKFLVLDWLNLNFCLLFVKESCFNTMESNTLTIFLYFLDFIKCLRNVLNIGILSKICCACGNFIRLNNYPTTQKWFVSGLDTLIGARN